MTNEYEFDKYLCNSSAKIADIRLLGDYCLVEKIPDDSETLGGLHIPESARDHRSGPRKGVVLAVGPGDPDGPRNRRGGRNYKTDAKEHVPLDVKVGDKVLYSFEPQNRVKIEGRDLQLCHEEQHISLIYED